LEGMSEPGTETPSGRSWGMDGRRVSQLLNDGGEKEASTMLFEMDQVWDAIGCSEEDRSGMLHEIGHRVLAVYTTALKEAEAARDSLQREIAEARAGIAKVHEQLGEGDAFDLDAVCPRSPVDKRGKKLALKAQLEALEPYVKDAAGKKSERLAVLVDVRESVRVLHEQLGDGLETEEVDPDHGDISKARLEVFTVSLHEAQAEKEYRCGQVGSVLRELHSASGALGVDAKAVAEGVDPSFGEFLPQALAKEPLRGVCVHSKRIKALKDVKNEMRLVEKRNRERLGTMCVRLQHLWRLLDSPVSDLKPVAAALRLGGDLDALRTAGWEGDLEIAVQQASNFSDATLEGVAEALDRLEAAKNGRMREVVARRREDLAALEAECHLTPCVFSKQIDDEHANFGEGDLDTVEARIAVVQEELQRRAPIFEQIDRLRKTLEERDWVREWEVSGEKFGRGAHVMLKRAERANKMVAALPKLIGKLRKEIGAWEEEQGTDLLYDGTRYLATLQAVEDDEAAWEEEKKRQAEEKAAMKKAQLEQFKTVKDSKPSVVRPPPLRRPGTAGAASKRPQTAASGSSRGGGGSENTPQTSGQQHVAAGLRPASARPGKTSVGSAQSAAAVPEQRVLTAVEPNVPIAAAGSGGKARETDEQRRARLCAFQMSIDHEDMCLTGGQSAPTSPTGTAGRVVRSSIAPSPAAGGEGGIRSPSIF